MKNESDLQNGIIYFWDSVAYDVFRSGHTMGQYALLNAEQRIS